MPEQDGLTTAKQIRNDPRIAYLPIIILTGYGTAFAAHRADSASVDAFLHKPISIKLLLDNINKLIEAKDVTVLGNESSASRLLKGAKVLLVEDNIFNQMLAREVLENGGVIVELANNGREALERLDNTFDAILMDVQMPEMDGFEATREIRKLNKENMSAIGRIPIIAMTAMAMAGDKQKCIDAGMDDYVTKPFDPQEILTILSRYVRREGDLIHRQEQCLDTQDLVDFACVNRYLQQNFQIDSQKAERLIASAKLTLHEELLKGQNCLTEGDVTQLQSIVHTIKGVLQNLNLGDIASLAHKIEQHSFSSGEDEKTIMGDQFRKLVAATSVLLD